MVDPMATLQLAHRQVVQKDYCYGIVRWAAHLANSVTVVQVDSWFPSLNWTTVAGLDEILIVMMVICVVAYWAASLAVDWLSWWWSAWLHTGLLNCLFGQAIGGFDGTKRSWRDGWPELTWYIDRLGRWKYSNWIKYLIFLKEFMYKNVIRIILSKKITFPTWIAKKHSIIVKIF